MINLELEAGESREKIIAEWEGESSGIPNTMSVIRRLTVIPKEVRGKYIDEYECGLDNSLYKLSHFITSIRWPNFTASTLLYQDSLFAVYQLSFNGAQQFLSCIFNVQVTDSSTQKKLYDAFENIKIEGKPCVMSYIFLFHMLIWVKMIFLKLFILKKSIITFSPIHLLTFTL